MKTDPPPTRVTVIGLGSIGIGLAVNLADADSVRLTVFNRSDARYAALRGRNAEIAPDLPAAVREADVVLLSLTDDRAVREVIGTIASHLRPGVVVVDTSTISPQTATAQAEDLDARDIGFVDSPVTGGAEAAMKGTLTLLCGADGATLESVRPILDLVAAKVVHAGPVGSGQVAKAVNQIMLAGALLGVAEGVALARAAGLDVHATIDALRDGAASSWVLRERAHHMADGDFEPRGRIALHHKDLRIALDQAAHLGLELPLGSLVADVERALIDRGLGDGDVAVIVRAFDTPSDREA